jgi:hypothetical protein
MMHRIYETEPFAYAKRLGGGILGETGTRNITLTATEFYDALNEFIITSKDTSGTDTFDSYSAGGLESTGNTQWDNLQYDNAGTLTTLGAAKYANHWFFVEMDDVLIHVYGTAQYNTASAAQAEGIPATLPDRITAHATLVGRMIFQKSAATANSIESAFEQTFTGALAGAHNSLSSIQGGTTDEYFHLTSAQHASTIVKNFGRDLVASDTAVTTGDGVQGIPIPASMNGMNLTSALAAVHDKGITGTTDIQIRRRRAGSDVDMLSTKITIGDEFFASDGVINTSNDDLATGDIIYTDIDAIHSGTAPNGLSVVFGASLP